MHVHAVCTGIYVVYVHARLTVHVIHGSYFISNSIIVTLNNDRDDNSIEPVNLHEQQRLGAYTH